MGLFCAKNVHIDPPRGLCREREQQDLDISGVYLSYGEGETRPRSSRVKSARYASQEGQPSEKDRAALSFTVRPVKLEYT